MQIQLTPGLGPILTLGHNLINLDRDSLEDESQQTVKL